MPRIAWDDPGNRRYQTGIDRGVLYTGSPGVPWVGLIGVTESSDGPDPQSFYVDGRKILDIPVKENYSATIEAYSFPMEFAPCAGRKMISPALYAGDQPRETFGLAYRTLVGDDQQGISLAYKVHLVYNAAAKVADFSHQTITDSPSAESRTINVTTFPITVAGFRPSAHYVFDTRLNSADTITAVEAIIYGDDLDDPRLPTSLELASLLGT